MYQTIRKKQHIDLNVKCYKVKKTNTIILLNILQ